MTAIKTQEILRFLNEFDPNLRIKHDYSGFWDRTIILHVSSGNCKEYILKGARKTK